MNAKTPADVAREIHSQCYNLAMPCNPDSTWMVFDEEKATALIAQYGEARTKPLEQRNAALVEALAPLIKIAEAYTTNNLDEARPDWGDDDKPAEQIELFTGRGGRQLLTLEDCIRARNAVALAQEKGRSYGY